MRPEQLELDWYIVLYCSDSAQEHLISCQSQDVSPSQLERLGWLSCLCFLLSSYDGTLCKKDAVDKNCSIFLNFP